ncbi:MAG: type IV pilus twitching motility protein PilT [Acidobacteria bacterium]|nr:type IV pilus twitching motility protein PilT [Acidobacteriota bacterium]
MDQIEQLLSKFKDFNANELHLEASQKPYFATSSGVREISSNPIQHKDIVQLISPILTPAAKSELIEKPGTEFQYRGSSGTYQVSIKKSSLGFNVIIRPLGAPAGTAPTPMVTQPVAAMSKPTNFTPSSATGTYSNTQPTQQYAAQQNVTQMQPPPTPQQTQPVQQPFRQPIAPSPAANSNFAAPSSVSSSASSPSPAPQRPRVGHSPEIDKYFEEMVRMKASDLHLSTGMPPMVRHDGEMKTLDHPVLRSEDTERILQEIMPQRNKEEFNRRHDTDFAYEIRDLGRFRSNIFMDRKGWGAVFRVIPTKILTAEDLKLSKPILDLCFLSKGLVVVTGPTGSGKSTTLAAMMDFLNRHRKDHVITIEDPIEFVHENKGCLVNQREVHNHTDSFKDALRAALREDPDIILVGEMRDLETIAIAIETAETGHLVFGTLHTTTAASTIDRIIDQFPTDRQSQIRTMLSESLKGVVAQTLLKKKGGGRIAALEILLVTPAISNLIREGKTFQIPSVMQTSKNLGMVTLNDALFEHVKNGLVSAEDAYVKAVDKTSFKELCKRANIDLGF